ncbi:MAG: leucine-rich repeat domain-containing protein [Muribaculaceae bacterium]|nr:leucine-rich repeat domain-containing protein [Muribaculaceae bacterium]
MEKRILTLCLMVMVAIMASAATKYEINIGGVEVTSDNAGHISGGDINSGYGVYNASSNTLILYNISIRRNGQDNYGIHNRKCDNLRIVFNGSCVVNTADNPLKLERSTTLESASGSKTTFYTSARICANLKSYNYTITGSGEFSFMSQQGGYEAMKGTGSGSTKVYFKGGKIEVSSYNRSALSSLSAYFHDGNHLEIKSNGSDASVSDVEMQFYLGEAVISPYNAVYSSSAKTVCIGSTPVTDKTIIISDDYVAILNSSYFPDQNFRTKLYNSYFNKGYINSTDVINTTSLNVSGCNISNLTGLIYFTYLRNLNCSSNNLSSLPTLSNVLTSLFCNNNQLTALPTLPSTIQTLYAGSNKFNGQLSITGKPNLTTLDVSNNTMITILNCSGNALTSLSYYGCTALKNLNCSSNNLSSLPTLPIGLTNLYCNNNKLTSLPDLPDGLTVIDCSYNQLTSLPMLPSDISSLNVRGNLFTTLGIWGRTKLKYLDCSSCSKLTTLDCANNALTSLNIANCPALSLLQINNNQLKGEAMGNIISSLPTRSSSNPGTFRVLTANYDGEGNVITTSQVEQARNKYWYPLQWKDGAWSNIPVAVPGDVNGDGYVSSADITTLYDYLLTNESSNLVNGDVDGDGNITSGDITAVYTILLGN